MIDKKPQCGEHRHQDDAEVLYGFFDIVRNLIHACKGNTFILKISSFL